MSAWDWTCIYTDRRGRERTYHVRDVGISASLAWSRAIDAGDVAEATEQLLSAHVVEGDWQALPLADAIGLATRLVVGEAEPGKSSGSETGPG